MARRSLGSTVQGLALRGAWDMPLSRPEKQRFLLGVYEEEMAALEDENARLRELLLEERAKTSKGCVSQANRPVDDPPAVIKGGDCPVEQADRPVERAEQALPRRTERRLSAVRSFLYPGEAQVLAADALESVRRESARLVEAAQQRVQAVQAHTRDLLSLEDMGRAASDEISSVHEDLQNLGHDIWQSVGDLGQWSRGWVGERGATSGARSSERGATARSRSRGTAREPDFAGYLAAPGAADLTASSEVQTVDDLVPLEPSTRELPLEPSTREVETVTNLISLE